MTEETEHIDEEQEQELFEHYRIVVDKGQDFLRIDKFLMNRIENATRNRLQNAAEAGSIHVNGKPVKSSYKVKPSDLIQVVLPHPPREIELIPQDIPIQIVYEDDDLVIVNKEPGIVVHPGYGNYSGTLVNALVFHFQNLPQKHSGIGDGRDEAMRPGLVHRIDKNTSGIIVIAKNDVALTRLSKKFFDRDIDRKYVALVWGDFEEESGTVTGNLGRSLQDRKIMTVFPDGDQGKHAVTHWKVLERFGYVTLIECKLETGRTHQIRAHMKYIGHPIFNDSTYGGDRILKGTTFQKYKMFIENCFSLLPRQALHAKSLGFKHPTTKEYVFFDSEMPPDMEAVLTKWRTYTTSKPFEE
jgi:23S rRNA pseudouridine1911/1915/1917 synthase